MYACVSDGLLYMYVYIYICICMCVCVCVCVYLGFNNTCVEREHRRYLNILRMMRNGEWRTIVAVLQSLLCRDHAAYSVALRAQQEVISETSVVGF